jgi:hypothetical protein
MARIGPLGASVAVATSEAVAAFTDQAAVAMAFGCDQMRPMHRVAVMNIRRVLASAMALQGSKAGCAWPGVAK